MTSKRIAFHHCRHCRSGSLISRRERTCRTQFIYTTRPT